MAAPPMPIPNQDEIEQALRDLQNSPPPEWLIEMIEYYRRTGSFRPEDVRRLMGDPSKGLRVAPDTSVEAILALPPVPKQESVL